MLNSSYDSPYKHSLYFNDVDTSTTSNDPLLYGSHLYNLSTPATANKFTCESTSLEQLEYLRESLYSRRKEIEFKVNSKRRERARKEKFDRQWKVYQRDLSRSQYYQALDRNKRIVEELKDTRLFLKKMQLNGETPPLLMLTSENNSHNNNHSMSMSSSATATSAFTSTFASDHKGKKLNNREYLGNGINDQLRIAKENYNYKIQLYLPKFQEKMHQKYLKKKSYMEREKKAIEKQRERHAESVAEEHRSD